MDSLLAAVTPAGMLGLLFLALWRGWVVPGPTVTRLEASWRERAAEAREREREWRRAHDSQEQISRMAVGQTERMVSALRTGRNTSCSGKVGPGDSQMASDHRDSGAGER